MSGCSARRVLRDVVDLTRQVAGELRPGVTQDPLLADAVRAGLDAAASLAAMADAMDERAVLAAIAEGEQ